ncbi:MAG: hypothetical protein FWF15_03620 [Oscillospiraceae bacterium]|nr:hypothetical protein [Oscillospiraceae bacterium]
MIENIIKKILDFDAMERKILAESIERKNSIEIEIAKKRSELKQLYIEYVNDEIELLKESERENVERILREKDELISIQLEKLNSIYEANKETWIEELFNRVVN